MIIFIHTVSIATVAFFLIALFGRWGAKRYVTCTEERGWILGSWFRSFCLGFLVLGTISLVIGVPFCIFVSVFSLIKGA